MTTHVLLQPTNRTMDLVHFARKSWKDGYINLRVDVDRVHVSGGALGDSSWRRRISQELHDVSADVKVEGALVSAALAEHWTEALVQFPLFLASQIPATIFRLFPS